MSGPDARSSNPPKVLPCLETRSLILRPLTLRDTRKILEMSREDGIRKWIPSQVYRDEKHASSVLAFLISQYRADPDPRTSPYVLGIELKSIKSTRDLVGHVGLSPLHGDVEVGYAVEQSQQRKGIATEAVHAMCDWAAVKFPGISLVGITVQGNVPSQRVLLRAGFKRSGERTMHFQGTERTVLVFTYSRQA
jgi:RimJ/RimL family protein N-acetyltransferase